MLPSRHLPKMNAPPGHLRAQLSHTARQHEEHTQSVRQASNQCRPRPQPRPSVSQQHLGCNGHERSGPVGLGRPPLPVAALQRRPAASPCHPGPTASFSMRLTACGRRVRSIGDAWWRRGGKRTWILHPPALPMSRSGRRGIRSRLLEALQRQVDPAAARPVRRCS